MSHSPGAGLTAVNCDYRALTAVRFMVTERRDRFAAVFEIYRDANFSTIKMNGSNNQEWYKVVFGGMDTTLWKTIKNVSIPGHKPAEWVRLRLVSGDGGWWRLRCIGCSIADVHMRCVCVCVCANHINPTHRSTELDPT